MSMPAQATVMNCKQSWLAPMRNCLLMFQKIVRKDWERTKRGNVQSYINKTAQEKQDQINKMGHFVWFLQI